MAIITVTNIADSGVGTLRNAVTQSASGDTIQFNSAILGQTIILASQILINKNLTIEGTIIVSGNNTTRVFQIADGGYEVIFRGVTISNGKTPDSTTVETTSAGGAILAGSGTKLTLENCYLLNNVAGFGGAIYTGFQGSTVIRNCFFSGNNGSLTLDTERGGGAIATKSAGSLSVTGSTFSNNRGTNGGAINLLLGSMTIEDSTFTGNDSTTGSGINTIGYGGAIYTDGANASGPNSTPGATGGKIIVRRSKFEGNRGKGQGGGIFLFLYSPDTFLLEKCTLINNQVLKASNGDAFGGGIRIGNGEYTVDSCTFANNIAESQGGAVWVGEQSPGTIVNSTFNGNSAVDPSDNSNGLGGALMFATSSPQKIINATIAGNVAGSEGGGIRGGSNVTLTNTIVSNNTANNPWGNKQNASDGQGFVANPSPYFSDGGGNIQWPAITNNFNNANITASVLQADPKLGILQDNGGGIMTMALLSGSAAINAGVSQGAPTVDQRGLQRPQSNSVDSGAFEYSVLPSPIIDHISPSSGDSFTEISISGSGFLPTSIVMINSSPISPTYISDVLLKVQLP